MIPYRTWGAAPYVVAVVHGGPGAPGEMEPVARELAAVRGILEPFLTATSVEGQVEELAALLREQTTMPVILVGFSWGAMLGILYTAAYPQNVKKLVLIDSGPLDPAYADKILTTRLQRLTPLQRTEVLDLLETPSSLDSPVHLARFGELMALADTVDPLPTGIPDIEPIPAVFQPVWTEAAALRASGRFLDAIRSIACPVVVIHGAEDPHPVKGVVEPLARAKKDPTVHLLPACGHTPWQERQARDLFLHLFRREIEEPTRR